MTEVYANKENCCGCTACAAICPASAVKMTADEEGFLYPNINTSNCIDCGKCKTVCAFDKKEQNEKTLPRVYAVKHKNEEARMQSSSGGAFTAISDFVLARNGVVYGAAFDADWTVRHMRAETREERNRFRGSKYVQSSLGDTFQKVAADLQKNKDVLFTGTPCQCEGLQSYLKEERIDKTRLLVCDLVCHGVPSPFMLKAHIALLEKQHRQKVVNYMCRPKNMGWHGHRELAVFQDGSKIQRSEEANRHAKVFGSRVSHRPSCHNCSYSCIERSSDITIGDFWGIENSMPEFDDNKGVSLVLVNTAVGRAVFAQILPNLIVQESNTTDCLQPQLQYPAKPSPKRKQFWEAYRTRGYQYAVNKYVSPRWKSCIVNGLRRTGLLPLVKKILAR